MKLDGFASLELSKYLRIFVVIISSLAFEENISNNTN